MEKNYFAFRKSYYGHVLLTEFTLPKKINKTLNDFPGEIKFQKHRNNYMLYNRTILSKRKYDTF